MNVLYRKHINFIKSCIGHHCNFIRFLSLHVVFHARCFFAQLARILRFLRLDITDLYMNFFIHKLKELNQSPATARLTPKRAVHLCSLPNYLNSARGRWHCQTKPHYLLRMYNQLLITHVQTDILWNCLCVISRWILRTSCYMLIFKCIVCNLNLLL